MIGINITDTAVITAVFFYSLCAFIISISIIGDEIGFSRWEVKLLLVCVFGTLIRGLFPVELSVAKSVYLTNVYVKLCYILRTQVFGGITVKQIVLFVWTIGILVIFTLKGMRFRRFHKFLAHGQVVQRIKVEKKNGAKTDIPVIVIKHLDVTFITGIIHPKIVLAENKRNDCELLLRHEIEHYRNHDLWYKVFLDLVCTVYWWNPLTIFLKKYTNNLLELENDLRIVKDISIAKRIKYAEMLIEAKPQKRTGNFSLGVNAAQQFLKVRMCSILDIEKPVKVKKRFLIFVLILVGSFFVVLEPSGIAPNDGSFDIESDNFYIREVNDSYHLYDGDRNIGEIDELPEALREELK